MVPLLRSKVLTQMRNQTIRIDGLASQFTAWPFAVNSALQDSRRDVNELLSRYFPNHPKVNRMKKGDYALFGATWWPVAPPERLRIATLLSIWLFMWDDEIDSDVGSLSHDLEKAQKYRADTMGFVQSCLGLGGFETTANSVHPIIYSFKAVGDALREECTREQRERFVDELQFFIVQSEVEQRLRLRKNITGSEEFWQYRMGTSAVRVVMCAIEYCNNTNLPDQVIQNEDMAKLWNLTNINISSVNDLLSVKKEIAQGSTESLVPILYSELGSVQAAVTKVLAIIEQTIKDFDVHAEQLLQRFSNDPDVDRMALQQFIQGCRYFCTGNLSWSLETGRYGVNQKLGQNEIYIDLSVGKAPSVPYAMLMLSFKTLRRLLHTMLWIPWNFFSSSRS